MTPPLDLRKIAPVLRPGPDGYWITQSVSPVSYPAEGNGRCFAVEDCSFWFAHRNRCILETMKRFPPPGIVFDVGGGNGYVARALQDAGWDAVLVEPGAVGVRNAIHRGVRHVVQATLEDAGILPAVLPAVGLFDVVEHTADDVGFLRNVHELMAPDGRLYVTVPAYQWLWSNEDVIAGHHRRYTLKSLRRVLSTAGYRPEFSTYLFGFLPMGILFRRVLPYRLKLPPRPLTEKMIRSDHCIQHPAAARFLGALMRPELRLISRGSPLPVGASCLAVARKVVPATQGAV